MTVGEAPAVVITGAGSGIGAACALRLDGLGWRVFAGVRRPEDGQALGARASSRLTPLLLDITDAASVGEAAERVAAAVGPAGLAGLVNNAGIAFAAPLEYVPIEALRRQLEVNVIGQIAVTQALLPLLRAGRGRIVFIGSLSGRIAAPFTGPYHASKFALEALTDSLRGELRPWRIAVAIVEPGVIDTPIWAKSVAAGDEILATLPAEAQARYGPALQGLRQRALTASRRRLPPAAVADAVIHALTARRPRTRYLVGLDAHLAALAARLPDRLRDWLLARRLVRWGGDAE